MHRWICSQYRMVAAPWESADYDSCAGFCPETVHAVGWPNQ